VALRRPYSIHVFLYRRLADGRLQVMLFHRRPREAFGLPAFWQGISGAYEPGEALIDAARREVFEESGFRDLDLRDSGFIATYPIKPEWRPLFGEGPTHVQEHALHGEVPVDAQPALSAEHSEWGWFDVPEALHLLSLGKNRDSLEAVLRHMFAVT
jgi:dihydroneopterin triphosphate diphosphatase